MRLATIDDKEFVQQRVATHGVEWSDALAIEVLTDPRYICVIDEEGVFYFLSEDGKTVHAGLHVGFEAADEVRYKKLWAFCFKLLTAKWPKAQTFAMNVRADCYAPNVYDVATTKIAMVQKSISGSGFQVFEVSIAKLKGMLGVR